MICGPVLIQSPPWVGALTYGSVLLASVPPASMYMTPGTPSVGGFLPIHAVAQAAAFLSMHIGSGPGVVGLSGMQVQPFLPWRKVFTEPSACASTMVVSFEMEAGAAAIALSIGSVGWAAAPFAASLPLPGACDADPARSHPASAKAPQAPSSNPKSRQCMAASS